MIDVSWDDIPNYTYILFYLTEYISAKLSIISCDWGMQWTPSLNQM